MNSFEKKIAILYRVSIYSLVINRFALLLTVSNRCIHCKQQQQKSHQILNHKSEWCELSFLVAIYLAYFHNYNFYLSLVHQISVLFCFRFHWIYPKIWNWFVNWKKKEKKCWKRNSTQFSWMKNQVSKWQQNEI